MKRRPDHFIIKFTGTVMLLLSFAAGGASAKPEPVGHRVSETKNGSTGMSRTVLIGIGDSLSHGTMDATNNDINTLHAYLQLVADSLRQVTSLGFSQPLFDETGERIDPRQVPTNLAVDGADIFSIDGIEYYKRVGAAESFVTDSYLCDKILPFRLDDKYDKVLYPINRKAHRPVSQVDSAVWLVNQYAGPTTLGRALILLWAGNNDSSTSALGEGGENPMFIPVPAELIEPEVTPILRRILRFGERSGLVSFEPYSQVAIERNLTDLADFTNQYNFVVDRLMNETNGAISDGRMDIALLTLPYYSSVGYLFDSEDLEYYLGKVIAGYAVPPTFQRVASPGEPITKPNQGDRISLLTFGMMYLLANTGYSTDYINRVLEVDGIQRDGLVLSEAEQQYIVQRIDGFNAAIKATAASRGPHVHLIDIGQNLNDTLTGKTELTIAGRRATRKWTRGGAFTLDGVHPGYTGQAFIANDVINHLNKKLGLSAPLYDLDQLALTDPYWDQDGDGWAPGPSYQTSGIASMLFLLTDSDDTNTAIGPVIPPDVWQSMSQALLRDLLGLPALRAEAARLGYVEP